MISYSMILSNAFKQCGKIFQKDKLIIVPHIFYFIIVNNFINNNLTVFKDDKLVYSAAITVIGIWVGQYIIKSLIIFVSYTFESKKTIYWVGAINQLIARLPNLLLSALIIMTPLLLAFYQLFKGASVENPSPGTFLGLIVIIPCAIIMEFLPIIIMVENKNVFSGIIKTYQIIINNIKKVILFYLTIISISIVGIIVANMLNQIPIIGPGILENISQAIAASVTAIVITHFYTFLKNPESYESLNDRRENDNEYSS